MSIPTVLVFQGGKVVEQRVGLMPKDQLGKLVSAHVGGRGRARLAAPAPSSGPRSARQPVDPAAGDRGLCRFSAGRHHGTQPREARVLRQPPLEAGVDLLRDDRDLEQPEHVGGDERVEVAPQRAAPSAPPPRRA